MASQKIFRTPLIAAAWEKKPSWAIVAANDKIINPEVAKDVVQACLTLSSQICP
jgi:hypothetical protein